jgi:lipid-binding SYLF domain-containing protein
LAAPLNNYAVRMGAEPFLPIPLNFECEKAARILQSFCLYDVPPVQNASGNQLEPDEHSPFIDIPPSVIADAVGLAIFTVGRIGFHLSGSTGSGVLVARLPDGRWSPPSGIRIHSIGAGITYGIDVYDCVCVLNTQEALEIFTNPQTRFTLGPDLTLAAGPYGGGGAVAFRGIFPDAKHPKHGKVHVHHPHHYHYHYHGLHHKKGAKHEEAEGLLAAPREPPPTPATPEQFAVAPPPEQQKQPPMEQPVSQPAPQEQQQPQQQDLKQPQEQDVKLPQQLEQQPLPGQPLPQQQGPGDEQGEGSTAVHESGDLHRAVALVNESLRRPVYSYIRSRGLYIGLQINGAVITERTDANTAFYGAPVTVPQILQAQVPINEATAAEGGWQRAVMPLINALKWAEGQRP